MEFLGEGKKMTLTTYLFRCRRINSIWLFWIFINSLCVYLNGILSARAISTIVNFDLQGFLYLSGAILAVNLLWVLQIYQNSKVSERAIQEMCNEIRKDIIKKIEMKDMRHFETKSVSAYTSWLTNDINTIRDLGFETLELMISQALNIIFAIIAFFSFHYSLLFSIFIFFILMVNLPKIFTKQMERKAVYFTEKNEELVKAIDDSLNGFRMLSNANQLHYLLVKILSRSEKFSKSRVSYAKTFGGLMSVQNGTSFVSQIAMLTHSGILYFYRLIPIGAVSSSQYFSSIIFAGLTGLTANYAEFKTVNKIFEKFELTDDRKIVEIENVKRPWKTFSEKLEIQSITIEREGKTVLEDVTFTIEKNKKYAIAGSSGSGKSTLLKAMNGEVAIARGDIFYDYVSSEYIDVQDIHQQISYVSLDDHIFNETILFNLTLGRQIDATKLEQAVQLFYLKDWISTLSHGLDTRLSEISQDISSGQKQRISLARAYLEEKPIMIIDEATDAIDKERRYQIEHYLFSIPDKTVIFVSHHLDENTKTLFDSIISLD
ncbi:ATP-binding cassette domain-containing protein [Streptococcus intermedius]|uniref:ATP-binding cassette domain-containing protein n=1 Tax=Streptococcus intermedius TaxID=1338 RepID=UPI0021ADFF14|nr:ABC transporter ATP-binding protein [Streptococcus intermedius]